MISREERIQELEEKRAALNQQLMNAQTQAEANRIERELWALRTALSYHRAQTSVKARAPKSPLAKV